MVWHFEHFFAFIELLIAQSNREKLYSLAGLQNQKQFLGRQSGSFSFKSNFRFSIADCRPSYPTNQAKHVQTVFTC